MPVAVTRPDPPGDERVDPRAVRSRGLILDAALEEFLARGYLAATVDDIAAAAGVVKRTVYNLFGTKEELFRAVVGRATDTAERFVAERVDTDVGAEPLEREITDFALAHARAVVTPRVVATRRLLIGEATRFPELAAEYYERVPHAVIAAITERLRRYAAKGLLRVPDPSLAADQFAYLVLGAALDRALFEPDGIDAGAVDGAARAGAEVFLRAYR